jgi:hypothetical protein
MKMVVCGQTIKIQGHIIRIARVDGDKYRSLQDPAAVVEGLRTSGSRVDLFTFMQTLPDTKPKFRYSFELDNYAALRVSTFDDWYNKVINFKVRNKVRKAEKNGIVVRAVPFDEALVQGIWTIYNECPIRQGKRFAHYGMTLEQVHEHAATFLDSSTFLAAFLGDAMVGFVKLVTDQAYMQAGLMHIVAMVKHRDKAPTNALIAAAVRSCAERRIPYLVYSNLTYGKKQRDSLAEFKEHHGFQKINVPRFYIPLTPVGWAAFRLGLHHPLAYHVPEALQAKLRQWRNDWNARKVPSIKKA